MLHIWTFVICMVRGAYSLMHPEQYCEGETFTPTCGLSEVVVIEKASYGRMRIGRCTVADLGNATFLFILM